MKGRLVTSAVLCAAVVLALAAVATAAGSSGTADARFIKLVKGTSADPPAKAWLGVQLQDVTRSVSRAMGLEVREGALIADVEDGSPAAEAGLQDGDVVTKFDGKSVHSASELTDMVRGQEPGSEVSLTVLRDHETKKFDVKLGDLEDRDTGNAGDEESAGGDQGDKGDQNDQGNVWFWRGPGAPGGQGGPGDRQMQIFRTMRAPSAYLGVELQPLSDQLGEYFGVKDGKGALISRVVEDSPADKAGLKAGDVITKVGDEEIQDPSNVTEQIGGAKPGESVNITYVGDRGRSENTVTVRLAKPPRDQLGGMDLAGPGGNMQLPRLKRQLDRMQVAPLPEAPDSQEMRQQMQELRHQMQQLRDQLQSLRDQMRQEQENK